MPYIVLDTETTNTIECPIVYDCGWSILDDDLNPIKERSFVINEVFFGDKELMEQAYFADKIPQYLEDLKNGTRKLKSLYQVRDTLHKDCEKYNVKVIIAHNAPFDYRALSTTQRYLTKSKYRWFMPFGIEIWDTLTMARDIYSKNADYLAFCKANNFMCKNGTTPRLTAEVLYRYFTKNVNFVEEHCGLEDTRIEREIFKICMSVNPNAKKTPWSTRGLRARAQKSQLDKN